MSGTRAFASILVPFLLMDAAMTQPTSAPASMPAGAERGLRAPADAAAVHPRRQPDRAVAYKKTPQAELTIHAYLPPGWKAADRRPAIVFFHGGGWRRGSPDQFFHMAEYFAGRGLVAFSAQYRLGVAHGTTPAESAEDARSAMRYVRKHAAEWGVDGARIISAGGSAGGMLAANVALCPGPDAQSDDLTVSCRPAAMVLMNPVLDMTISQALSRIQAEETSKRKIVETISPAAHLHKTCPPAIVFFGTADRLLPPALPFLKKSAGLGNRAELWTAEGQEHGFFNASPWQEACIHKADEFLVSLGYLTGKPTIRADKEAVLKRHK